MRKNRIAECEKRFDRFYQNNRRNLIGVCLIAAVAALIMWVLNALTPLAADDFNYHYIFWDNCTPDTRITSLADIVRSMQYHYCHINGRILAHGVLEFFALIGKPWFNFVNTAMYLALSFLIYKHWKGAGRGSHNALLYLLIHLMLWLFVPSWGQTFIWMDGSINYLWGSVLRLAALLPFRLYGDEGGDALNQKRLLPFGLFPLALLAGATNENTGAAMIGMMALFMIWYKIKKKRIPVWSFTGLAGAVIGYCFMFFAPANFTRAESAQGNSFLTRLLHIPGNYLLYFSALLAVSALCAYLLYHFAKERLQRALPIFLIYWLGTLGGAGCMLLIARFPARAWFGVAIAMILAAGALLRETCALPAAAPRSIAVAACFCCLYCAMSLANVAEDCVRVKAEYNARVQMIAAEKAGGKTQLRLPCITVEDPHAPLYGLSDLNTENADNWSNQSKAAYYGVESILGE